MYGRNTGTVKKNNQKVVALPDLKGSKSAIRCGDTVFLSPAMMSLYTREDKNGLESFLRSLGYVSCGAGEISETIQKLTAGQE